MGSTFKTSTCRNGNHKRCNRQDGSCGCFCHGPAPEMLEKVLASAPNGRPEETAEELSARIERTGRRRVQRIGSQMRFMRTCCWDLETSNLNANFGIILCSSIKTWGGDTLTQRIDDDPDYADHRWDDSHLVEAVRDELENYQVIVGWNHVGFDLPMLESRLVKHGLRPLDKTNMCFVDMLWASRYRMRLSSNTLERVIEYLSTKTQKTPLIGEWWIRAMAGDREALDHIVEHNIKDVESLEEVTEKLSRFVKLQYKLVK